MANCGDILKYIYRSLSNATSFVIAFLLIIVFGNVVARYVFNQPFHWGEEVASIALILATFFPAAELWQKDGHIKFDLISLYFKEKHLIAWYLSNIIISIIGFIFTAILVWQTVLTVHMCYVNNMKEPSLLGTPIWFNYFLILTGYSALLLVLIASTIYNIKKIYKIRNS